jgi:hypothetical protein
MKSEKGEMISKKSVQFLSLKVGSLKKPAGEQSLLPMWLFRQQDLLDALEQAQKVNHQDLINKLNYIHFMGDSIYVNLSHTQYKEEGILFKVNPEPCMGLEVTCRWTEGNLSGLKLENYQFRNIIIADGQSIILVPATLKHMDGESLSIDLSETGYAIGLRRARRYDCQEVTAELIQSGFIATGVLLDFNSLGFRIKVNPGIASSFNWLNADQHVTIHLYENRKIIYSGFCRVIRQTDDQVEREIVLVPVSDQIKRFKSKEIRNVRQKLIPVPTISFNHPLCRKRIQREVYDISVSGFSVHEKTAEGVLMPGMVISDLTIHYVGILKLKCTAQVLYRREEDENRVLCGLAILDMDVNDYSQLSHILSHASDPCTHISKDVDMGALWEFFFDTNFLYPQKYSHFHSHREVFKETYKRLYQESPEIARHFTYEQDGRIYGHISMVRAYERGWLIHHYAARPMENKLVGFLVLKQIMQYLNGIYLLPSAKMDYLMTYFRPENKIVSRVFGGYAMEVKDPQKCSVDVFSYLFHSMTSRNGLFPEGWTLKECSALELWELDLFYKHRSGGLLLHALGLGSKAHGEDSLKMIYKKLGFKRDWAAYSLIRRGNLKAVLVVNQSDLGVNLSELLNCIKVLVIDTEGLPHDVLSIAFHQLTDIYQMGEIPVLIYPPDYLETKGIACEKHYALWILNMSEGGDQYLKYMQRFRVKLK